ncbi:MAG TPA: Fe-S cluster assembly protein SufB [Candidatus Paceibacterota bacterium]|nr:Fe-S cluster assembly protein SufB [Candidatus Paceibacterota bacterium]
MLNSAVQFGPTEELVRHISAVKDEPAWMLDLRLNALRLWQETPMPTWGPDLSGLDFSGMSYFADPLVDEQYSWSGVPKEIKQTFIDLGIPEAEREYLGGVGAQFDSGSVYHHLKATLEAKGVLFENMDTAVEKYPELVREYFMTSCVAIGEHKFAMLHAACWSGGTFIYVPKGVTVELPLQAYFRMNKMHSAQFEHTLIIADEESSITYIEGCSAPQYTASSLHAGCVEIFVKRNAAVRYISVENWSKNTFNLNTKKAIIGADARMTWVGGNMGSKVSMLYPSSVLLGDRGKSEALSVVVAGAGQVQDVGAKVIHIGKDTSSMIRSKSISKDGGISHYRGLVKILPMAIGATTHVQCDGLLLDNNSISSALPVYKIENAHTHAAHEARVGRVDMEALFYAKSRGLSEAEAIRMLVGGFVAPIAAALPLEYAIEFNRLLDLEF